tara:strand:+ start:102 stop:881 length:780 start_codon:yes stop_codon:yes gene_type:complete
MNTLHVFGDSFSEPIEPLVHAGGEPCNRVKYARDYLKSKTSTYPIWSELLSTELGYNHVNHAGLMGKKFSQLGQGNSNHSILYNLNEYCNTFKRDDIVIVGFTITNRFPYPLTPPYPNIESAVFNSLPNMSHDMLSKKDSDLINNITLKRDDDFYKEELLQLLKSFEVLADIVGFKLYYWSWVNQINNYKVNDKLLDNRWIFHQIFNNSTDIEYFSKISKLGGYTISEETNYTINDNHFGETGNKVFSDLLYDYLKKMI